MKPKELMHFIQSLWNRGLLSQSPEEFDYEWLIWDYLGGNSGKPSIPPPPTDRILQEGGPIKPPKTHI